MPPTFPIDFTAVRIALVRTMVSALGLPSNAVIMAEPEVVNSPRPAKPYFSVKIMTGAMRYGDDVPDAQTGDTVNYGGPRGLAVSFNVFALSHEDALSYMTYWQARLDQPDVQEALRAAGIAVWQIGAVADLSILVNTGYEGRAHMDCVFGLAANSVVTVGTITSAPVTGDVAIDGAPDAIITLP